MIKKLFIETGSQDLNNPEYAFFKMIKENNDEELEIINVEGKDKLFDDKNRSKMRVKIKKNRTTNKTDTRQYNYRGQL